MNISMLPDADGMKCYAAEDIRVQRVSEYDGQCEEHVFLPKGHYHRPVFHAMSDEELYVIRGSGSFTCGGVSHCYSPGSTFHIPRGVQHGFSAHTETVLFSLQKPPIVDLETGDADIHCHETVLQVQE
ncbi:MAG: cupin domain-containing protein [Candidatus Aenigmarchaeota archaeon]|nr:cupin domain-containing protein [Candidatus Aenigmarchaeota archaeon]